MKKAVITCVTGLDSSYLAEFLLEQGYEGEIVFDASKQDGSPRKLMNVDLLRSLSWKQEIDLMGGLKQTYFWFLENQQSLRSA